MIYFLDIFSFFIRLEQFFLYKLLTYSLLSNHIIMATTQPFIYYKDVPLIEFCHNLATKGELYLRGNKFTFNDEKDFKKKSELSVKSRNKDIQQITNCYNASAEGRVAWSLDQEEFKGIYPCIKLEKGTSLTQSMSRIIRHIGPEFNSFLLFFSADTGEVVGVTPEEDVEYETVAKMEFRSNFHGIIDTTCFAKLGGGMTTLPESIIIPTKFRGMIIYIPIHTTFDDLPYLTALAQSNIPKMLSMAGGSETKVIDNLKFELINICYNECGVPCAQQWQELKAEREAAERAAVEAEAERKRREAEAERKRREVAATERRAAAERSVAIKNMVSIRRKVRMSKQELLAAKLAAKLAAELAAARARVRALEKKNSGETVREMLDARRRVVTIQNQLLKLQTSRMSNTTRRGGKLKHKHRKRTMKRKTKKPRYRKRTIKRKTKKPRYRKTRKGKKKC